MDKNNHIPSIFKNRIAVLATMHKKEKVISPIFEKEVGIQLIVPKGFNSDTFGTFTGDVKRTGDQFDAARLKAEAALKFSKKTLAVASEGSFGSHPVIPFLPFNREIVLLKDSEHEIELVGVATSTEINYKGSHVYSFEEALSFAESIGFPDTGVVVKAEDTSHESIECVKGIISPDTLREAVESLMEQSKDKSVFIETDLRAMYNPKRMKVIEEAAKDLVSKMLSLCPDCSWPGFQITEKVKGLPCSWCNLPTDVVKAHVYQCEKCGYIKKDTFPDGKETADPGSCNFCNP